MNTQVDYLGQAGTPSENRIKCTHRYRICDCGNIHCLGPCGFVQSTLMPGEVKPEKRAPCEFHKL